VATVVCSGRLLDDLARAVLDARGASPAAAHMMAGANAASLRALELNPMLGRRIAGDLRELVISSGATGLVALYRFVVVRDEVRVLALRRQLDLGYRP
jgi:plasmid stabilization system protein ParE